MISAMGWPAHQPKTIDIESRSEAQFQLVLDTIPGLVWSALPDGNVDYLNQRYREYTGLALHEIVGWGWQVAIHPDDLKEHVDYWKMVLASGQPGETEARLRRSDGVYRWFLARAVPLFDKTGKLVKWYGQNTDIHERKCAEEKIQLQAIELRQALDLAPQHVAVLGPDSVRLSLNQAGLDYFGITLDVWRTCDLDKLVHPEELARMTIILEAPSPDGPVQDQEARLLRRDGKYRWFLIRLNAVRDGQGQIARWYIAATDIEDRKQAEQVLRESEANLRQIVDSIPGLVTHSPDGEIEFANQHLLSFFGRTLDEMRNWSPTLHPDDRARVVDSWLHALKTEQPFEFEYRVMRADGMYRSWHSRGQPLRGNDGRIVRWSNLHTDIHDRKQAEEKVKDQERELRQIVDVAPQHVSVVGPDGKHLYANQVALDYYGLTLEEWQSVSDLHGFLFPEDRERLVNGLQSNFSSGAPHEFEARMRRNDAQYRWFLMRYFPLRDEQNSITRWYIAGTDIDDRKQAEERVQLENVALREEIDKASMFEEIVGTSHALHAVLSRVSKVAPTDSTVLITGETGTGKELVARAIHRRSHRSSSAFVSVNCAAIPRDLIASELFGHEKGAFTGATQQRLGRFELAGGGTIFLDEVGDLPSETQVALLRVLQEHEFQRVGGTKSIHTDVRVIAATNRELHAAIASGTFRSDLFYRLNVFPVEIPPLRARKEDIPMLVEYFIDRFARKTGKSMRGINRKRLDLLQSYPWPGNIRELQNVIERSLIVCETENFSVDESWLTRRPLATEPKSQLDLSEKLAAQEKEMIETALRESRGQVFGPSGAAAKLGMARSTLESKIRSLKINKNRFKT